MKHPNLMNIDEEPSDEALAVIMQEVAKEAKEKDVINGKTITDRIQLEIKLANERFNK